MNHMKNNNHSECCGGDKPQNQGKDEKDSCCDSDQAKKSEAHKTEKQEGCCSNKN